MTDQKTRLGEIRERWAKVTAGPWELDPKRPGTWDIWGIRRDEVIGDGESHVATVRGYEADAEALAWAPEDIAWLLDEIKRLKEER
ncbi:MAG TPA: hypothetical protein VIQ11_08295 [Mycobacterium sp.]